MEDHFSSQLAPLHRKQTFCQSYRNYYEKYIKNLIQEICVSSEDFDTESKFVGITCLFFI